jgi:hypothetical protein
VTWGLALLALQLSTADARDPATFTARVAAFDARERQLAGASTPELRARAALEWLEALKAVLAAVPIERTDNPIFSRWLNAHDALVIYSEPSGEWLLRNDLVRRLHEEHRHSMAADEIAWIAATNGLPGECEGYVPCYAFGLNHLDGEYLRQHPQGRHRVEALNRIAEAIRLAVDDLLARADASDFLKVPDDCPDLSASLVPLRQAVAANPADPAASSLREIDRLAAYCRQR